MGAVSASRMNRFAARQGAFLTRRRAPCKGLGKPEMEHSRLQKQTGIRGEKNFKKSCVQAPENRRKQINT